MNNNHLIVGSHEKLIRVEQDGTKVWDSESAMWQLDMTTGEISMPLSLGDFRPRALNDAGLIVGHYPVPSGTGLFYGLDINGDPIVEPLPTLAGYDFSEPMSISENGQWVAGIAEVYVEGSGWYFEACVWNVPAGTVQGLGTLSRKGWNGSSVATSVNNHGQVVGWSDTGRRIPQTAFLWEGNSMIDLNDLADTGSFQLIRAKGISNDGRVIGVLRDSRASEERGFLLVPVPDSDNP